MSAGDVLVALDARRAGEELVARLEKERKPGSSVKVTVFRRDVLETHRVRLGGRRASVWRIETVARCARQRPTPEEALAEDERQRLKKPA